ncbi:MAG: class I SAM-dependent methyltransferase [Gaiellaceae bacterium]
MPRGPMVQHDTRWESALSELPRTRRHFFLRAYGDEVNRMLLERWLPKSADRVLKTDLFEEAWGDGLARLLGQRFRRVDAVDVSRAVVDAAARRHTGVNVVCCDVRGLPYENGTFDAVVSTSTLDHFEDVADIAAALRELRRVLAPGGTLIVSLDNLANPLVAVRNALPFGWLHRVGLVPHYVGATCRPRELQELLARAGFDVNATTAIMHVPRVIALAVGRGMDTMLGLERLGRLPTRFLTGQFVAARAVRR